MLAVELKDVSKSFGQVKALEQVSLSIQQGEVVALLGPNGAGKSTAISLMLGLRQTTSGTVKIFGLDPREPKSRLRVGAMLQESELPNHLKTVEVLELFAKQYSQPIAVSQALELSGLTKEATQLASRLSGGQRKRLCFALALIGNPDLLFLDEPTAALDVEARQVFWAAVRDLVAQGKTILLTTHYLEEADALAQRIVVIAGGRVVASGTPEQIKANTGGKRVSFVLESGVLKPMAETSQWQSEGQRIQFLSQRPETALQQIFATGAQIRDLEVVGVGLEEAFVEITKQAKGAMSHEL